MSEIWLQFKVRTYVYDLNVNLASKENEQVKCEQGTFIFHEFL